MSKKIYIEVSGTGKDKEPNWAWQYDHPLFYYCSISWNFSSRVYVFNVQLPDRFKADWWCRTYAHCLVRLKTIKATFLYIDIKAKHRNHLFSHALKNPLVRPRVDWVISQETWLELIRRLEAFKFKNSSQYF